MRNIRERGSIMVEALAVIALLGVMGTMLFRQVQHRNEELDNINMASEIRIVKEATAAYVQANKAALQAECQSRCDEDGCDISGGDLVEWHVDNSVKEVIEDFMPEHWRSDDHDGIMWYYDIYMRCYMVNADLAPRKAIDAFIIPMSESLGEDFPLKRAARVANLIGSDGGIHIGGASGGETVLHGTMGSWEVECPADSCDGRNDNFFVATTGVDVYESESELKAVNTVSVPESMAFTQLHSQEYFSVGANCVQELSDEGDFLHQTFDENGHAKADQIVRSGNQDNYHNTCEPLFWVSVDGAGSNNDHSTDGQVYVKNSLYVGRDNANEKQAFALETGNTDNSRQFAVYSADGSERLTLDANGRVVGRSSGGKGYRLDAETGEIILFNEVPNVTVGSETGPVQVPVMRLSKGAMETGVSVTYQTNKAGEAAASVTDVYKVDPAYTSIMNDIRLTSRGGAKLSDILPNYITKNIYSVTADGIEGKFSDVDPIPKPECPAGYVRAITVTPVSWSQYVKTASLTGTTEASSVAVGDGAFGHTHSIAVDDENTIQVQKENNYAIDATDSEGHRHLRLEQYAPLRIEIGGEEQLVGLNPPGDNWIINLSYGGVLTDEDDPITALVQTYCVFDEKNFDANTADHTAVVNKTGIRLEAGEQVGTGLPAASRACSTNADCLNTESCTGSASNKKCTINGTCSQADGVKVGNKYCIGGVLTTLECLTNEGCSEGQVCKNYRCISDTP